MAPKTSPDCPSCHHQHSVPGSVEPWDSDAPNPSTFHPEGSKHWIKYQGVGLHNGSRFRCCLQCGLVWNFVDQEKVKSVLEKLGVPRGKVPARASYAVHVLKWVLFILACAGAAAWMEFARRA